MRKRTHKALEVLWPISELLNSRILLTRGSEVSILVKVVVFDGGDECNANNEVVSDASW